MKRTLGPSPQGSCGTRGGEPKSNLGFAWKDLAPSVLFPRISPDTRQPPFSHLVCTPQPLHGTDDCGLATGCEGRSRGQEASPSTDPPDPPGSEVGNFNPFLQRENPGDLHRTASRASDLVARTVGDPVPPQRLQISRSREEQSLDPGRKGASRNKPRRRSTPPTIYCKSVDASLSSRVSDSNSMSRKSIDSLLTSRGRNAEMSRTATLYGIFFFHLEGEYLPQHPPV